MENLTIALVGSRNFPARHGGLEVVVESIAKRFAARKLAVHVFVSNDTGTLEIPLENEQRTICIHPSRAVKGKYWHTASQILFGLMSVRRLRPDIVNIHGVGPAFPLAISPRAFGEAPTVVTAHGLDWDRSKWPPFAKWIFKRIAIRALRNATSVSCVSRSVGAELSRLAGVEVITTSNGFDPVEVKTEPSADLPDQYAVAMSRLTPEKNLEAVIAAYDATVASKWGPLVVIGGGAGSYADGYEAKLKSLAEGKNIIFLGHLGREDALAVLMNAGVYISMSKLEAQPMAVLEAMAFGVPLILSDIAPHKELCGEAARYVSADDVNALAQAMLEDDQDISRRIGIGLRRIASTTWEASADAYVNWYSSCVSPT